MMRPGKEVHGLGNRVGELQNPWLTDSVRNIRRRGMAWPCGNRELAWSPAARNARFAPTSISPPRLLRRTAV